MAAEFIKTQKYEAAELLCDEVIKRKNSLGVAFTCKGQICANNNEHEAAIEYYRAALRHGSDDDAVIKYYLALSLFSIGRHREGWQSMFAARTECKSFSALFRSDNRFDKTLRFNMQPPPAVVHIHADAGNGDNFLLMRYMPLLAQKGYTVRYETRPNTVKLARDSFPEIDTIPIAEDFPGTTDLPPFDYHLPIPELPFLFETDIGTIPWSGRYIKTDPALVEKYKAHKGKIGICWTTGPDFGYPKDKSIPFEQFKQITDDGTSRFVSLVPNIDTPIPDSCDWAETAALIENLDLIISVDTAVAHLAGAMGKPIWLMMHKYTTSFQFMSEYPNASWNEASPWYPTMRIFRQKTKGDWAPVIKQISAELGR